MKDARLLVLREAATSSAIWCTPTPIPNNAKRSWPPRFRIANAREVGRRDASAGLRGSHRQVGRFTVDRLISIINRLGSRVEVKVRVRRSESLEQQATA